MTAVAFNAELFEKNMTALQVRNPALARRVREASDDPMVVVERAKSDELTLILDGKAVLSRYDPGRDVQRTIADEPEGGSHRRVLVVLGLELGYLARALWQRTQAKLHVIEPRLGVWRATCGAVDLSAVLADDRAFLYDRVEDLFFRVEYEVRLEMNFAVYHLPAIRAIYQAYLEPLQQRLEVVVRDSHIHTFTNISRQVEWFRNLFDNFPHYIRRPSIVGLRGALRDVPAVVVSAGPSLDKNAELLREWKGRGAIISVGTALGKCQQLGVAPDLVVALESNDITDQFADKPIIRESSLALLAKCHPKLWDIPAKNIFFYGNFMPDTGWMFSLIQRKEAILGFSGSVATAAFSIAAFMGCRPIVLIGQDLAYGAAGASHASGIGQGGDFSVAGDKLKAARDDPAQLEGDMVLVDGYHGGKVVTRTNLRNYLLWFEKHIPDLTGRGIRVINATEGGARIHGAQQLTFAEATSELLGDPRPITVAIDERCAPEPFDVPAAREHVHTAIKELVELQQGGKKLRELAKRTLDWLNRPRPPVDRINRALQRIGRDEKRLLALVKSQNDLLTSVGGRDILLTKTAFDYEGLSQIEGIGLNMKQTETMHRGVGNAATLVLEKLRFLEAELAKLDTE